MMVYQYFQELFGFFGQLFKKGRYKEIKDLYSKLKHKYGDRFYIEIQRHGDENEIEFEKYNLSKSLELKFL